MDGLIGESNLHPHDEDVGDLLCSNFDAKLTPNVTYTPCLGPSPSPILLAAAEVPKKVPSHKIFSSHILVDKREKAIQQYLSENHINSLYPDKFISIEGSRLNIGDYVIDYGYVPLDHVTGTKMYATKYIIERKTITDFHESVSGSRFREQLMRLSNVNKRMGADVVKICYLFEDSPRDTIAGHLSTCKSCRTSYIRYIVNSESVHFTVLFSKSKKDTANIILDIAVAGIDAQPRYLHSLITPGQPPVLLHNPSEQIEQPKTVPGRGIEEIVTNTIQGAGKKSKLTDREINIAQLRAIPSIGYRTAVSILDAYNGSYLEFYEAVKVDRSKLDTLTINRNGSTCAVSKTIKENIATTFRL